MFPILGLHVLNKQVPMSAFSMHALISGLHKQLTLRHNGRD